MTNHEWICDTCCHTLAGVPLDRVYTLVGKRCPSCGEPEEIKSKSLNRWNSEKCYSYFGVGEDYILSREPSDICHDKYLDIDINNFKGVKQIKEVVDEIFILTKHKITKLRIRKNVSEGLEKWTK